MRKDIIWILIIANACFTLYWGYDILFKPIYYTQPVFLGEGVDRLVIFKRAKIEAPIPKFIKHHLKLNKK